MVITPQTEIRLLKVPFTIDNKNQLTFASKTGQTSYFTSLSYVSEDNATYQRKDNAIRYPAHIDDIILYNYVMYKNEAYTDKWFYAYITNMTYVNDNLTSIEIETDVFQTWQFDISLKQSFVEREHTNDDTIGANTIDENLNVGEVLTEYTDEYDGITNNNYFWFVIACNYQPATDTEEEKMFSGVNIYGSYPQGSTWFAWSINYVNYASEINEISEWIMNVTKARSCRRHTSNICFTKWLFYK